MVGQKRLRAIVDAQIEAELYPRFSIITGPRGSGKKTMAEYIANKLLVHHGSPLQPIRSGIAVVDIRTIILNSYKNITTAVYIIPDADNMSIQAKNSLLKITEEPPNNTYFIMTVENLGNALTTLKSRARVYQMDLYTNQEIQEFLQSFSLSDSERELIISICYNPGDCERVIQYNISDFYNYCNLVLDNIGTVSGANAFKITNKVDIKGSGEGYDIKIFLSTLMLICMKRAVETDDTSFIKVVPVTADTLKKLSIRGVNKQMLLDSWILNIREILRGE